MFPGEIAFLGLGENDRRISLNGQRVPARQRFGLRAFRWATRPEASLDKKQWFPFLCKVSK
jgi:hypothetical protein